MGRVGAVAVAKAVKVSRGLQRLELDDNQISEDGVEHLKVCGLTFIAPAWSCNKQCFLMFFSFGRARSVGDHK